MTAEGQDEAGGHWSRSGTGSITVHPTGPCLLEWEERGQWQAQNERPTSFRNRLRWTWDISLGGIQLQHLRRGADRPVHLVDLVPDGPDRLISAAAHHCDADRYVAELLLLGAALELRWEVTGPAKRYTLRTSYTPGP